MVLLMYSRGVTLLKRSRNSFSLLMASNSGRTRSHTLSSVSLVALISTLPMASLYFGSVSFFFFFSFQPPSLSYCVCLLIFGPAAFAL